MVKRSGRITAPRLWLVIAKSSRALSLVAERSIANTGLCLTDFAALEALLHKGPLTISADSGQSAPGQWLDDGGSRSTRKTRVSGTQGEPR